MNLSSQRYFGLIRASGAFALALGLGASLLAAPGSAQDKYATAAELGLMQGFPPPPDKRVTKATAMKTAPFNRWSYQHMRMFYPSANVPAADVPVPLSKTIAWGFEAGVKIKLLCLGKSDFEVINGFLEDAYLAEALALDRVPSEGILRRRMDVHAAN